MYSIQLYTLEWVKESQLLLPFERAIASNLQGYRPAYYVRAWDGISVLSWDQHLVHFCLGYIRPGRSIQLLATFGRSFRRDEAPWDKWRPGDQIGLNWLEVEAIYRAVSEYRTREKQDREIQTAKPAKVVAKVNRKRVRKIPAQPAPSKSELDHHFIESCFTLFELQCSITGRRIGGLDCRGLSVFWLIQERLKAGELYK